MSPVVEAALRSWSIPPAATLVLCVVAVVYLRGWWRLRIAGVPFVSHWRAIAFVFGILVLWLALASPLDTFSGFVLTAHMLQHMLLMMAAPPLILMGAPLVPLVRGLPDFGAREFAGPFLNWRVSKKVGRILASPICGLLLMGAVMFAWHVPRMYELALHSAAWHQVEHACFFIVALIFWYPVIQPWPSRARWPRWAMVPYLLLADVQNTALCAILIFSDRVLYPSYGVMPRLFGSALEDQAAAGAMMWVVGSLAFVLPAIAIAVECLSSKAARRSTVANSVSRIGIPISPFTLLPSMPVIGWLPPSRLRGRTVEAAVFVVLFVALGLGLAVLASSHANDADDQTLRFTGPSGPFLVAVFGPPGDLPTGHTDFGVLVQDRNTQDVQLDATVDLTAVADSDAPGTSFSARAVQAEGENKLLQTAELNLPTEGNWRMYVSVKRNSQTTDFVLPIHVVREQTAPDYLDRWSYIALVTFGAILLVVYARRHRTARSDKIASRKVSARNLLDVSKDQRNHRAGAAVLSDFWALTKPDVNFLILVATFAGFYLGCAAPLGDFPFPLLIHTLLGTLLVAGGTGTLNQYIERRFDAQMRRTARRPLAAGRLKPSAVLWFGVALSAMGSIYLAAVVNLLASLLAMTTLLSYLFFYTPLKRKTPLCTVIGALPGAMPPLIGWSAASAKLNLEAWTLFAVLFLWQFPHFMAIAWMYREDYDRAGYLVLPRGPARSLVVTLQTQLPLLVLSPLSLLPAFAGPPSILYCIGALLLGLGFFFYGTRFVLRRTNLAARQLFIASIVYLPSLLGLMVLSRGI